MATIDVHYFRVCTRGAERQGLDRSKLLAAGGVTVEDTDTPGWRGSADSMSRIVQAIWIAMDDEHMGCTAAPVRSGALAMMTELAMNADNVLAALQKGIAFYSLLTDGIRTKLDVHDDNAILTIELSQPDLDPDHYFTEFWLIIWHRFASWLSGETVIINRAEFSYDRPTSYYREFAYLFPAELSFNQPLCRLHLEKGPLLNAIGPSEPDRRAFVARAPLDFMTIPSRGNSMGRRVRRLLAPRAGAPFIPISLNDVASALGTTALALSRELRSEGVTYTRIVETIRRDLAISRLQRGNTTVEAIAAELGYAEPRSFTRAFQNWTGSSPLRFRRELLSRP